jgi:hypothetical protein
MHTGISKSCGKRLNPRRTADAFSSFAAPCQAPGYRRGDAGGDRGAHVATSGSEFVPLLVIPVLILPFFLLLIPSFFPIPKPLGLASSHYVFFVRGSVLLD